MQWPKNGSHVKSVPHSAWQVSRVCRAMHWAGSWCNGWSGSLVELRRSPEEDLISLGMIAM